MFFSFPHYLFLSATLTFYYTSFFLSLLHSFFVTVFLFYTHCSSLFLIITLSLLSLFSLFFPDFLFLSIFLSLSIYCYIPLSYYYSLFLSFSSLSLNAILTLFLTDFFFLSLFFSVSFFHNTILSVFLTYSSLSFISPFFHYPLLRFWTRINTSIYLDDTNN